MSIDKLLSEEKHQLNFSAGNDFVTFVYQSFRE